MRSPGHGKLSGVLLLHFAKVHGHFGLCCVLMWKCELNAFMCLTLHLRSHLRGSREGHGDKYIALQPSIA